LTPRKKPESFKHGMLTQLQSKKKFPEQIVEENMQPAHAEVPASAWSLSPSEG